MGLEAAKNDGASARLIAAGRVLLAQGEARFSLTRLCTEAGVTLEDFRASFASKAALLQQLMEPQKAEAPQADPWLERRLRVFERALGTLEERSEKRDRDYRQSIARLEEKLAALGGAQLKHDVAAAAERAVEAAPPMAPEPQAALAMEDAAQDSVPEADPLALAPLQPMAPPDRAGMDFLEAGRRAALAHARALERTPRRRPLPARLLLVSVLAMMTLLCCAIVTFGHSDHASAAVAPEGTAHRLAAATPLQKLIARADSGDARAERDIAFAYLRGDGLAKDLGAAARWAQAAAAQGDAEAQYLAGSLYRDGAGVPRDTGRAFAWFERAAAAGQIKAMHNLAIAYLQGDGTVRDEAAAVSWFARAAAGGYVDSAFDLAVLYEKGQGVPQDAKLALRWYRAAAAAGDAPAAARAKLLAEQAGL